MEDSQKIIDNLNEAQYDAVISTEGYVRVIAGAGSGKTRALVNRYAYLIKEVGVPSSNILCITFTNKAAKEMKNRVRRLLGDGIDTSFVATLHSYCTRILREDIGRLFYPESFIVLDNADQKKILEEVYDELGIKMDTASFDFMIDKIKYEKNLLKYIDYVAAPDANIADASTESVEQEIIFRYIQKQKKYFALDFFDLINFVIYLFDKYSDIERKWQERMHYVMVDEFQDITSKEFKLIRRLTAINKNWFVVGDPDQNIYEWRGSRMDVILNFDERMSPCKTIMMNENYRSSPEIIAVSNSLIDKNVNRIKKSLFTNNPSEVKPIHFHAKNDTEEIGFIVKNIKKHIEQGGKFSDISVIYRSNFVSRFVEQGFLKANIPYMVYGGVGFFERMEIKDVLSYLRLVASGDDLSFLRIVNVPRRRIGKTKINFLKQKAEVDNSSLYQAMVKHIDNNIFASSGAADFIAVIEKMRGLAETLQVSELLQRLLIDSQYELYIRESGDMDRLDNVAELVRSIVVMEQDYGESLTLSTFLQDITLHRDISDDNDEQKNDKVKIMTAHTAKGLEFHTVFISGFSDGIFPSARAMEERKVDALEEERRLAYVAMTRAKHRLFITESEGAGFRGYSKIPSRFIFDIEKDLLDTEGVIPDEILNEFSFMTNYQVDTGDAKFSVGMQVKHKIFGEGRVEAVDGITKTYTIRFVNGIKPISFDYKGLTER